jgi:hypothetical protein
MKTCLQVCVVFGAAFLNSVAFSQTRPSPPESPSLPVRGWWTMDQHAVKDLDRAEEFGINLLIIEHHSEDVWNEVIHHLATYDFSDKYRKSGADREKTERYLAHYREITAAARRHGVPCYLQSSEPYVPKALTPADFDNPELWSVVNERLREVFRALPDLTGVTVYLTEGQTEVEKIPGSEQSKARRARKVIDTMWAACRAEKRRFMVGTFIHSKEMLDAVAEALRSFPPHPDFAVLQYCCPNDWGLYEIFNPSIGRVGPHPEILGFDYNSENWGQSTHPFIQVDFLARRLREALARSANLVGVAGWTAWYGHRTLIGTLNEANVYAGAALAARPDRDPGDILHEWCAKRFGDTAAPTAASCLARTFPVVFKAQHVFGYWVDTSNKSGLPSLWEMDKYFIVDFFGEALGKWDPAYKPTWDRIQSPDDTFLRDVLKEKDEAIALARQNLADLRAARDKFKPDDFKTLDRAFTFQELWARIWREQMHAFFLRQIGRRQGWTDERRSQFKEVLATLSQRADELESTFGKGCFPHGPQRIRELIRDLQKEM